MNGTISGAGLIELDPETGIAKTSVEAATDVSSEDGSPEKEARQDLLATFGLLWARRRKLKWIALAGTAATAIVVCSIPEHFRATTRILAAPDNVPVLAGILTSRTVEDRLVARFQLKKAYGIEQDEDARIELEDHTVIDEGRGSGVITLTVTDKKAQRAADLCNAYGEESKRMMAQLSMASAQEDRRFLEERADAADRELESREEELSEFASANELVDIEQQDETITDAETTLRRELIAGKSELKGLTEVYADGNSRIKELSARIRQFQKGLDSMSTGPSEATDAGFPKRRLLPSLRKLSLLGAVYSDLSRDSSLQEADYEVLSLASEAAKIEEQRQNFNNVAVLDPGIVPDKGVYPPRIIITIMGLVLSAAGAILWVLGIPCLRTSWAAGVFVFSANKSL